MHLPTFSISQELGELLLSSQHEEDAPTEQQERALSQEQQQLCADMAQCIADTGLLVVRDARVSAELNSHFLDTMERYFEQEEAAKAPDVRPELHFQVGMTPEGVEVPRILHDQALQQEVERQPEQHRATLPRGADVKCRFFHRVGPRPAATAFPELNASPVTPKAFPDWSQTMDTFGGRLLDVARTVTACVAQGLGVAPRRLVAMLEGGPHLLAPTGSDLGKHGQLGTVLAGYHSDLNLLTVHGQSRFPGLHVWLRDGTRHLVRVPPGCLIVQAGQQLEWLTGGHIQAGKHEVVVCKETLVALEAARQAGRSLWRISSTLFAHTASDQVLQPVPKFASLPDAQAKYPPTPAGLQVQRELEAIRLAKPSPPAAPSAGLGAGGSGEGDGGVHVNVVPGVQAEGGAKAAGVCAPASSLLALAPAIS